MACCVQTTTMLQGNLYQFLVQFTQTKAIHFLHREYVPELLLSRLAFNHLYFSSFEIQQVSFSLSFSTLKPFFSILVFCHIPFIIVCEVFQGLFSKSKGGKTTFLLFFILVHWSYEIIPFQELPNDSFQLLNFGFQSPYLHFLNLMK